MSANESRFLEEVTLPLLGPLHHDLKQVETSLQDAIAVCAVKNRLLLEDVQANYAGVRRKCGKLFASYYLVNTRTFKRKA